MCELMAMSFEAPVSADFSLREFAARGEENPDGWGLGWCVTREPQGVTAMLSPGTFGHGGAYGTQAWIDPVKKRAYILMIQRADFPNSDASEVRKAFQESANASLDSAK